MGSVRIMRMGRVRTMVISSRRGEDDDDDEEEEDRRCEAASSRGEMTWMEGLDWRRDWARRSSRMGP